MPEELTVLILTAEEMTEAEQNTQKRHAWYEAKQVRVGVVGGASWGASWGAMAFSTARVTGARSLIPIFDEQLSDGADASKPVYCYVSSKQLWVKVWIC